MTVKYREFLELKTDKLSSLSDSHKSLLTNLIPSNKIKDILLHFPNNYENIKFSNAINPQLIGENIVLKVNIRTILGSGKEASIFGGGGGYKSNFYRRKNSPYKLVGEIVGNGMHISLTFFSANKSVIQIFQPGTVKYITGKLELFNGIAQINHPRALSNKELQQLTDNKFSDEYFTESKSLILPNYPLSYGLTQYLIRRLSMESLDLAKNISCLHEMKFNDITIYEALKNLHFPQTEEVPSKYRKTLAYFELLAEQSALNIARREGDSHTLQQGVLTPCLQASPTGKDKAMKDLVATFIEALPFHLTPDQAQVIKEINHDIESGNRMMRLVQGDVGSGKTAVAFHAIIKAISMPQKQGALMVPSTLLATQHFNWFSNIAFDLGLRIALLTGNTIKSQKDRILAELKNGEIDIVIGTHALIEDKVEFKNLAMAVIDEQHRFGVKQRLRLAHKNPHAHLLMLTATPIPRTMTMALYGDIEVSKIAAKPQGRKEIDTRVMPVTKLDEIIRFMKKIIEQKGKIYWVCPLIEQNQEELLSEDKKGNESLAAIERFKELEKGFGTRVALIHGQIKPKDQEKIMNGFAGSEFDVLIATTVVEVGVNVPEANLMIIENAGKFGLSQLHQLRGRVGRSDVQSYCFLLYNPNEFNGKAAERLQVIKSSNDGFFIAESDLQMRGGGEILGDRQSGYGEFKIANLFEDQDVLSDAAHDAKTLLKIDLTLTSPEGEKLKDIMRLFDYEEYIEYINS